MQRYRIYTDASCNTENEVMVAAYLICTNRKFITHKEKVIGGNKITEAETVAVGLALEYILKTFKLNKDDIIEVHTDSDYARDVLLGWRESDAEQEQETEQNSKYKRGNPGLATRRVRDVRYTYKRAMRVCQVLIICTNAHSYEWNTNVAVDRLAKYKLAAVLDDIL